MVADGSIVRPELVGNPIPTHRTSNNYFDINTFAANHTNFAPPATNVSNPSTFGVLQSAPTARTAETALDK
jgi:hypothetical protein